MTGSDFGRALIFAAVAGVAITNCIVYANGTTSSNGGSSGSGDENIGIDTNCALVMLILNIIIAIIAIMLFIYFMWLGFKTNKVPSIVTPCSPQSVVTNCPPNVVTTCT